MTKLRSRGKAIKMHIGKGEKRERVRFRLTKLRTRRKLSKCT